MCCCFPLMMWIVNQLHWTKKIAWSRCFPDTFAQSSRVLSVGGFQRKMDNHFLYHGQEKGQIDSGYTVHINILKLNICTVYLYSLLKIIREVDGPRRFGWPWVFRRPNWQVLRFPLLFECRSCYLHQVSPVQWDIDPGTYPLEHSGLPATSFWAPLKIDQVEKG